MGFNFQRGGPPKFKNDRKKEEDVKKEEKAKEEKVAAV